MIKCLKICALYLVLGGVATRSIDKWIAGKFPPWELPARVLVECNKTGHGVPKSYKRSINL